MMNPVKQYRRMQRIVDYYEGNMLAMMRCQKYAELGLLLLSNVKAGDTVYLIGSNLRIFSEVRRCNVRKIEFIGQNDAMIYAMDVGPSTYGEMFHVRNRQFNKLFFRDEGKARERLRSIREREVRNEKS